MLEVEMVKKKIPLKKILDLDNFHQNFILPKALKCHV